MPHFKCHITSSNAKYCRMSEAGPLLPERFGRAAQIARRVERDKANDLPGSNLPVALCVAQVQSCRGRPDEIGESLDATRAFPHLTR
jgi:hypothetical protein